MLAEAGTSPRWSYGPGFTVSVDVLVLPPSFPVTVCAPEAVAVQVFPVHEPSGVMLNVVFEVTSPSELSYWSRPSAVYVCEPPDAIDAEAGASARWSSGPAV